jgi:hypothetical protein
MLLMASHVCTHTHIHQVLFWENGGFCIFSILLQLGNHLRQLGSYHLVTDLNLATHGPDTCIFFSLKLLAQLQVKCLPKSHIFLGFLSC